MEQASRGECCSSCDIEDERSFDIKDTAVLLLKAIKELEVIPMVKNDNEDKLISWLRGSRRDWLSASIDTSETFGRGLCVNEQLLSKNWWSTHLRQAVHLEFINIKFRITNFLQFSRASRAYTVSDKGEQFLKKPFRYSVLPPTNTAVKEVGGRLKNTTRSTGTRGKHYLPKIRELLKNASHWSTISKREDYEFPGFGPEHIELGYCPGIKKTKTFGSCQRVHYMWDDCQLTKRNSTLRDVEAIMDGKKTAVNVRRTPCESAKRCASDGCSYTVSNIQCLNKCGEHGSSKPLVRTGACEAQLIYIWPKDDDGRRWVGILPGERHNHAKPAPHLITQTVKNEIHQALMKDCTLTVKEIQKGQGIGYIPAEVSPANAARIRREKQLALVSAKSTPRTGANSANP